MVQEIYIKFRCERCGTEVTKDAGKGLLGFIRKPKYPDGWQTIHPHKQPDIKVCPTCASEYDQLYAKMYQEYMIRGQKK